IRTFIIDLVEHLAHLKAPKTALKLAPDLRRRFGVGNSTGLGMAPFLVRHPILVDRWIANREQALALVRALPAATPETRAAFRQMLGRARRCLAEWRTADGIQAARVTELLDALAKLDAEVAKPGTMEKARPW